MKKYIYFIASMLLLSSCVGLEQYPTNSYTDDNFWQQESNVKATLNLGYNQCWNADRYFDNNLLSDDVYGSRHSVTSRDLAIGTAITSNGRARTEWYECYMELRTLHTGLDNYDRMAGSEAFRKRFKAEFRLMRAFTYLRLVTWFGDVPFFTTNPTLPETKICSRTSAETIKAFIHSELEDVIEDLPKNTEIPAAENGRYTKGTAIALNARAYLLDNDFENCALWCSKLIDSDEFGHYELAENYADLFKSGHYGPESIMTIEFATNDGTADIVRGWNTGNYIPNSICPEGQQEIVYFSPTQELVNCFRKLDGTIAGDQDYNGRDLRFYSTIAYNGCTLDIPEAENLGLIGSAGPGKGTYTCYTKASQETALADASHHKDSYTGDDTRTATGYYMIKNYDARTVGKNGGSYKSLMEIRYADVLLMYAESMFETGGMTADVWNKTVKPLRKRAGFNDAYCEMPSGDLRQVIRDERRCELALEGRRPFDVRRWALLDNPSFKDTGAAYLTTTAHGAPFLDSGENITCNSPYSLKYWFPIPQHERDINHNLTQNPGW